MSKVSVVEVASDKPAVQEVKVGPAVVQEPVIQEPAIQNVPENEEANIDAQNAALQHSQGGVTTRDDKTDLGVPMLPGSPNERQGPEDALGEGPKRGDYSGRIGGSTYHPHEGAEPQKPRVEDIGDVPGKKGGVETAPNTA